jgi:glycosyltransferase involved in cell wall biosynthesis
VWIHTSSTKSFYRKSIFILTAALIKKKIILHIHPTHFFDFLISRKGLAKLYVLFVSQRVHCFVVLTKDMQEKLRLLFPEKKIYLLKNPVDITELRCPKAIPRAQNRLLFLGWFIPEKGVYELVDAVELLLNQKIDLELYFYGTKQIDRLSSYVKRKQLQEKIHVNGWIDLPQKIEALYSATILVLPSHSEGIPNVILEAMATHTPIIATSVGGLSEILVDGLNAIISEPKDPVNLSQKIRLLIENKELREKIAEAAYNDAVNKYDISIIKRRFAEIISDITKSK